MIGRTRWRFRSVESTQDIAFRLAAMGAVSGTIVRADYQSAGRGRLGRSWEAPANSALMFSVVLRPDVPIHQLGPLSIQTAYALCGAITAAGARNVALKWPNDVLINGRKVSGILVQTRLMSEPVAVVGIGINISTAIEGLPPTATSLTHEIGDHLSADLLFDEILSAIDSIWSRWQPLLTQNQIDRIDKLLWLKNERVTLLDADRELSGVVLGISPDGGLRLMTGGEERTVRAGEITRGPRPTTPVIEP